VTDTAKAQRRFERPALSADIDRQEQRFARSFQVLRDAIDQHAFPGAAISVTWRGEIVALSGTGRFTYEPDSSAVQRETVYDLASVTKVVATTPMAMILYDRGLLDIEAPVMSLVPEFGGNHSDDPRRAAVTVRMLLAHASGLPAYVRLFEKHRTRDEMLRAAFATRLESDPGTRAEYSDIGFIVLGELLSRVAGEAIDTFCQREVFGPLGMSHTGFLPPADWKPLIPPTVDDRETRGRIVQGEVHDENAWAMGGVAGHAGVFGNCDDLARFAQCMLDRGMLSGSKPLLRDETIKLFTQRQTSPAGTSRALGWDTPSSPSQSGKYFSPHSFGHLGYTGTSLWIDPERDLAIALLTNRTWPDRSSQAIKQVRPQFHDAVVEAL
jgi:CubicO group peptidase (beta-lactamase class C family)